MKGFTLLELLITVGIISILSGITIVAVNPAKQFAQANDANRFNDVNSILSAVGQYTVKHRGAIPPGINSTYQFIANTGTGLDICEELVGENFLNVLPIDPSLTDEFIDCGEDYNTGYQIKYENSHVSVHAPHAQEEEDITVTY